MTEAVFEVGVVPDPVLVEDFRFHEPIKLLKASVVEFVKANFYFIVGGFFALIGVIVSPINHTCFVFGIDRFSKINRKLQGALFTFLGVLRTLNSSKKLEECDEVAGKALGLDVFFESNMCKERRECFLRRHVTLRALVLGILINSVVNRLFKGAVYALAIPFSLLLFGQIDKLNVYAVNSIELMTSFIVRSFLSLSAFINPNLYFHFVSYSNL